MVWPKLVVGVVVSYWIVIYYSSSLIQRRFDLNFEIHVISSLIAVRHDLFLVVV